MFASRSRNLSFVTALPAVTLAAGIAMSATASAQSVADRAPTIQALSDLIAAERDRESKARLEKLYPAPAPKALPEKFEALVKQPEAPKVRQVLSIYGPVGREMADMVRADGVVETVKSGGQFDGFKVVSISPDAVTLEPQAAKRGRGKESAKAQGSGRPVLRVGVGAYFQ